MASKILIIGIDSATFDVINPLMNRGLLPNLKSLIEGGTAGKLMSTIPPVTPPAWTSFMTGMNPGKHGVYDFYVSPSHGYYRPLLNSKYIKTETIWKIISDHGLRVGVINLPMTYPPENINGFVIPGMQYSLNGEGNFSHPPELMEELQNHVGNYRVLYGDLESLYTSDKDKLIDEWRDICKIRKKAISYLLENKKWDVFAAVFYSIDVMQHHFYKFFDKNHPLHDPTLSQKYENIIPEFYQETDQAIGEILTKVPNDTTIIVVSDHGAGAETGSFYLNNWLQEKGFLKFNRILSPLWRFRFPHLFYKMLRRLGFPGIQWTVPLDRLKLLGKFVDPREGLYVPMFIDWKRTVAYAGNHTEQGIYINVKGREPSGLVAPGKEYEEVRELLISELTNMTDPLNGDALKVKFFKKEEIYSGPYLVDAPDILLEIKGGEYLIQKEIHNKNIFGSPIKSSGTHRMDGIIVCKGKQLKQNYTLSDTQIIDLAPTILYLLSIPVPEDMDGRVLLELFKEEFTRDRPINYSKASTRHQERETQGTFSTEESEKIKKSLRDLGYL